jgi:hypothetical protein
VSNESRLRMSAMGGESANSRQSRRENGTSAIQSPLTNTSPGLEFRRSCQAAEMKEKSNAAVVVEHEAAFQINDFEKLQNAYANQASLFDEATEREHTRKQNSQWATIYDAIKLNPRWQKLQQCITQVKDNREEFDYKNKKKDYEKYLMNKVRELKQANPICDEASSVNGN